ncbi:hypothetical protein J6590_107429, partial [Homalodisca vitripennis]
QLCSPSSSFRPRITGVLPPSFNRRMLGSPGRTDVCLALPMVPSSVFSEASYFGPWSGSAAWMQGSDSALPRATPSTYGILCVSVLGKQRFGLQRYTRSRPMNGPLLAARCAGDKKAWTEKEQAAFKRSSIMQRSPTLTTGTPTRGLKTSPPPVPFKAVSDTGSSSGSGKTKEEVDLAMEVTNPETPQAKKEGIPPSKSPLRAAFGLQMLQQQHDDASEEEDLSLNKMKALLKEMAKALLTQRNVNKAIKDGIPKLDDFLGEIEECRKIRLKAVKQERDVMNRVISDSPQAQAHLAESQTQARKRAKRQRGSSSGSPELRELDPAPNPVFFSASTQTEDVPAAALVPAPVWVPAPAAALIPASIPSTPLNSQGPTPQTPLGNWDRRLSKKERRRLKRAEAASKKMPAKGKKKAQVSEPIKTQVKLEETETTIKSIRRTQNGDVLLELGKSKDKDGFAASLKTALGDKGSSRGLQPRCSVEI